MRKAICIISVFSVLLICLSSCSLSQNLSETIAGESESAVKMSEILNALTENRLVDVKNLMHPEVSERSDDPIARMSAYLVGRKVTDLELKNINIKTSTGTSGKSTQEDLTYSVTLNDGEIIYVKAVFLTNDSGSGFYSFQLVLGVI